MTDQFLRAPTFKEISFPCLSRPCLQILVVKQEFEIAFEPVFEITDAKLSKSAAETLFVS